MAYGVLEGISSKPNPSCSVLEGVLEKEKEKGELREAVERERAGSHDKQVGHREERERGKCQKHGSIICAIFKSTRCKST